jgi:type I restriction enzyme, S subunit
MSEVNTALDTIAFNVAEKVTPRLKDPDLPYVGLEQLTSDVPRIVGSLPSSSSIGINTVFEAGDTLFGKLRPNLRKIAHAQFGGYCSTDILVIRARSDVDPSYLSHTLRTRGVLDFAVATAFGTKMPRTSWALLAARKVFAPELSEQRKIAEVLDTLDEQIHAATQVQGKLEQIRMGLLDSCVDSLADQALVPLSELCSADICYGIVQSGPFVAEGVPVLAIRDLAGDFTTGVHRTSNSIDARYLRSRVDPGDVLLSIKGTIGRVGVAPGYYTGNISREIARLRFSRRVDPLFARQYLLSRWAQRRLDLAVVGTTRAEISIHVLKKFGLPVPDPEMQRAIVSRVAAVETRIAAESEILRKLGALRLGLAESLLTGRVRVAAEALS